MKIILLILCNIVLYANYDSLEISLLTCSRGNEIYSSYGHSSLRVINLSSGSDLVYNFGMFDFKTPNIALKLIKGNLKYYLGVSSTQSFVNKFDSKQRVVTEQKLNLNENEKSLIVNALDSLSRPEYKYYQYEFLNRNCTTELRELIFSKTNGNIKYTNADLGRTFRDLINDQLAETLWLKFGINLITGTYMDQKVDVFRSLFLPEYFMTFLQGISVNDKPLVVSKADLNIVEKNDNKLFFIFQPVLVFSVFLVLLSYFNNRILHITFLLIFGILGSLLTTIVVITGHVEFMSNLNLLWCNPLYLILAVLLISKSKIPARMLSYLILFGIFTRIVFWVLGIQGGDISFIPIMVSIIIINIRILLSLKQGRGL